MFVSNIPQALAPSADLVENGDGPSDGSRLWVDGRSRVRCRRALGYLATVALPDAYGDRAAAIAAGGLLAMLTNSLMPFAFERGKDWAGAATVVGFCLSMLGTA